MDSTTLQSIKDAIDKNNVIGIAVGRNPNIDEMAASLSLYLSLSSTNKQVSVASPSEPIVEVSTLVGIDKVKDSFESDSGDLIVSFPYKTREDGEGEIQKVSYTVDGGFLNIVVKASDGGLSFTEKDVKYRRGGNAPKLIFVIGTQNLSDLGDLYHPEALKDSTVINIDNKQGNQGYGDIVAVSSKYSSVSEEIADLLTALDFLLDIDIAQNLMTGISYATDNFQKSNTSFLAFEMASILLRKGAVRMPQMVKPSQEQRQNKPQQQFVNRTPQQQFGAVSDNPFYAPPRQNPQQGSGQQRDQRDQQGKPKDPTRKPPADWLMPKVYKGSTNI